MDLPPQIGITWARLTNAMREGLESDTVRLGHKLDGMAEGTVDGTEGVTLTFEAPRSGGEPPPPVFVRGCVVGADGRNSRVRELAFGAEEDDSASAAAVGDPHSLTHPPTSHALDEYSYIRSTRLALIGRTLFMI